MNILATIFLAGGCFWGVDEYFSRIPGVVETTSGYAQSQIASPTYEQVCSGGTGAAETVRVVYDPAKVSLQTLVRQYFKIIDPYAVNRQGNDIGTQYRTGIYYNNPDDRELLDTLVENEEKKAGRKFAVQIQPLENFYPAEQYHQDYLKKHPGGYCHINFDSLRDIEAETPWKKPADAEIRQKLSREQYIVTRQSGTEPPFSGQYWDNHEPGIYVDIVTGEPLFLSSDKFDSGTGWPSFTRPVEEGAVKQKVDESHGMRRVEVRSSIGDSHLGHVFNDGPREKGGLRYCINSAALRFVPLRDMAGEGYGYLENRIK